MEEKTYKIGEAAELLKLKSYVLRFWETEFPQLAPLRTEKGQRLYSEADLGLLKRIRHLLHERGMTIEGARRVLADSSGNAVARENSRRIEPRQGNLPFLYDSVSIPAFADDDPGEEGDEAAEDYSGLDGSSGTDGPVVAVRHGAAPAWLEPGPAEGRACLEGKIACAVSELKELRRLLLAD